MRSTHISLTNISILLIFLFIQSCASTKPDKSGIERSALVTDNLNQVQENVLNASNEVNEVESSLSEVIRDSHPDIKSAFESFSEDVNQLEKAVNQLYNNSDMLKKNANAYLSSWQNEESEYESARLQEISSERHAELKSVFDAIQNSRMSSEQSIRTYLADIKDIRDFLDNDLTSEGVQSVSDLAQDVLRQSDEIKDQLSDLEYALEEALEEMDRN